MAVPDVRQHVGIGAAPDVHAVLRPAIVLVDSLSSCALHETK